MYDAAIQNRNTRYITSAFYDEETEYRKQNYNNSMFYRLCELFIEASF